MNTHDTVRALNIGLHYAEEAKRQIETEGTDSADFREVCAGVASLNKAIDALQNNDRA